MSLIYYIALLDGAAVVDCSYALDFAFIDSNQLSRWTDELFIFIILNAGA